MKTIFIISFLSIFFNCTSQKSQYYDEELYISKTEELLNCFIANHQLSTENRFLVLYIREINNKFQLNYGLLQLDMPYLLNNQNYIVIIKNGIEFLVDSETDNFIFNYYNNYYKRINSTIKFVNPDFGFDYNDDSGIPSRAIFLNKNTINNVSCKDLFFQD